MVVLDDVELLVSLARQLHSGGPNPARSDRDKGDARRLGDLFGLTVGGALRYTATVEHPDLTNQPHPRRDT
ncbi:hypothetical protein M8C13_08930 [Crossiella sp. SN42]|uniref:hypothetical protein n=1 Tax=Crossiella sp. SN42 TaxID=2944808 RepID=UPI00207C5C7B|nr:hypothetical protein [Crossiella sp. SN42]MCO1575880.1 hypothetical protein [Crossiella sp. SN42]